MGENSPKGCPGPEQQSLKASLQGSLEKWLITGIEQEINKMGLKGLAVSEKKEVLYKSHAVGGGAECGKGAQEPN